jgi:uncharacterized phiE125 gp8 family phage protein
MALRLITAPTVEPFTLVEAKARLRIDTDESDDDLWSLLVSARQEIDGQNGWLGRALLTQTWEMTLPTWGSGRIRLPLPPTQAVNAVAYRAADGTSELWSVDQWQFVSGGDYHSWLEPVSGVSWPSLWTGPEPIAIRFTAGWPTPEQVPQAVKTWIMARAGGMYAQPEAMVIGVSAQPVPMYEHMLASWRVWT